MSNFVDYYVHDEWSSDSEEELEAFSDEEDDEFVHEECDQRESARKRRLFEGMDIEDRLKDAGETYIVRTEGFSKTGPRTSMIGGTVFETTDKHLKKIQERERMTPENRWKIAFDESFKVFHDGISTYKDKIELDVLKRDTIPSKIPRWVKTNPTMIAAAMSCDNFMNDPDTFEERTAEWFQDQVSKKKIDPKKYTLFDVQRYTRFWYRVALKI